MQAQQHRGCIARARHAPARLFERQSACTGASRSYTEARPTSSDLFGWAAAWPAKHEAAEPAPSRVGQGVAWAVRRLGASRWPSRAGCWGSAATAGSQECRRPCRVTATAAAASQCGQLCASSSMHTACSTAVSAAAAAGWDGRSSRDCGKRLAPGGAAAATAAASSAAYCPAYTEPTAKPPYHCAPTTRTSRLPP